MNQTDEWYHIEGFDEHTHRIVEGPYYGLFLVKGTDRSIVIDAGIGIGDLAGLVSELVDTPVTLLLTHWHWDHIGNASQFDDVRIHGDERAPDGTVAIDALSDEFTHRPSQFAREWVEAGNDFPDGFGVDDYSIRPATAVTPIAPGDTVELGQHGLEALHTPGHSPGHLSFLDRDRGILYGGDVIHLDAGLYVHFQHSSLAACLDTFETLLELRDAGTFDTLLTSHNPPFVGDDLAILDRLRDGLKRILDGDATATVVDTAWGEAHRYTFDGSPIITQPSAP